MSTIDDLRWCPRCQRLTPYQHHSPLRCHDCGTVYDAEAERRGLFHHLWGLAVHSAGYVKAEWQHIQRLLHMDGDR